MLHSLLKHQRLIAITLKSSRRRCYLITTLHRIQTEFSLFNSILLFTLRLRRTGKIVKMFILQCNKFGNETLC